MGQRRAISDRDECQSPIEDWRRVRLLSAGFTERSARALACDRRADLHALLALVDRGCPPELAARILAPLDAPECWPR